VGGMGGSVCTSRPMNDFGISLVPPFNSRVVCQTMLDRRLFRPPSLPLPAEYVLIILWTDRR
jgi:hypothetical protein